MGCKFFGVGDHYKSFTFVIIFLCTQMVYADQTNNKFIVNLGFLNSDYEMMEKAQEVNILNIKDDHAFGLEIVPPNGKVYRLYTIDYLPGEPKVLGGSISGNMTIDFDKGIKSHEVEVKGVMYVPISFDEGDPLGEYKMEVFINDKLIKILKYNVVAERK